MVKSLISVSLALAACLLGGCAKEEGNASAGTPPPVATMPVTAPATQPRTIAMQLGGETFHLEIAANDHDQQLGLMYRESMPKDHGMIFVFGPERKREFWMRNTLIPLDIVYVNAVSRVVSIKHGVPLQEVPTIPSDEPMKWAIELNYGAASAVGLRVGNKLAIPAEAQVPEED